MFNDSFPSFGPKKIRNGQHNANKIIMCIITLTQYYNDTKTINAFARNKGYENCYLPITCIEKRSL